MTSCNFSEDNWIELFYLLFVCKKLIHLIVSRNSLGEAGDALVHSIDEWGPDPPLQVLQLDQCFMPEITWARLLLDLRSCKNITHLDLSYNKLDDAAKYLTTAMSFRADQQPLQKLDLSYCSMSANAYDDLFGFLTRCKRLSYLDVSGNMIGEAGCHLAGAIKSWGDDPPLETFIAEHCFIPIAVWPDLLTSLSACSKLVHSDLSHNYLTGCLSSFLPGTDQILAYLEELLLDCCSLSKKDLQHLIKYVDSEKLPSLKNLYLHDNGLFRMKNILGDLIQCFIDHCNERKVNLWVQGNFLPQSFMDTWIRWCENTNVSLDLQIPTAAEKNLPTKVNRILQGHYFTVKLVDVIFISSLSQYMFVFVG